MAPGAPAASLPLDALKQRLRRVGLYGLLTHAEELAPEPWLVRVLEIEGVDLQPCGGTHVARTAEIGRVSLGRIEKKGRQNRRVTVLLEE